MQKLHAPERIYENLQHCFSIVIYMYMTLLLAIKKRKIFQ